MEGLERTCWLEVELQHPKGWSMIAEGGGVSNGYLKIDSRTMTKIELKWKGLSAKEGRRNGLKPLVLVNRLIEGQEKKMKLEVLERGSEEVCGHKAYLVRRRGGIETKVIIWHTNSNKIFVLGCLGLKDNAELINGIEKSTVFKLD